MRIAIDCHNLEGNRTGVGRYLWNLLREWRNSTKSDNFEFFLYFKNEAPQDISHSLNAGSGTSHIEIIVLNSKSNALYKHLRLPWAAFRDKADILFCPDYVLPLFKFRRYKTAVTLHDIVYEARPDEYSWPSLADKILLKWASKTSARRADVIFCPSNFTKTEIEKYYKVNPAKIIITRLAPDPIFRKIDFTEVEPMEAWVGIKEKYGIRDKYIFFVGSIFNRRFLPKLIDAFEEFSRERKDFQFLIIGKNHTRPFQDIGAIVKNINSEMGREAVVWREFVEDDEELVFLYNMALATLWVSSYEGFGLPVLESMACGTPVITSHGSSLEEVGGDAAIYIEDPKNRNEISVALSKIVNDDNYRLELSQKCTNHGKKFLWEYTSEKTFEGLVKLKTRI